MGTAAPESQAVTSKPRKKYFVVSADCHILEPPDLWERRIEAKFRHRLPKVEIDSKGNRVLVVEGARSLRIRDNALEGEDLERAKAGRPDLETRLRDLDRDGIDAEVIYPNRGLRLRWWPPSNQVDLNLEFGPLPTLAEDYFFSAGSEPILTVAALNLLR